MEVRRTSEHDEALRGTRVITRERPDVRVISLDGGMLQHFTLDPSRRYQPQASWVVATMLRHITESSRSVGWWGVLDTR